MRTSINEDFNSMARLLNEVHAEPECINYKGYTICTDLQDEDDNIKTLVAIYKDRQFISGGPPTSPYEGDWFEIAKAYIDLGLPKTPKTEDGAEPPTFKTAEEYRAYMSKAGYPANVEEEEIDESEPIMVDLRFPENKHVTVWLKGNEVTSLEGDFSVNAAIVNDAYHYYLEVLGDHKREALTLAVIAGAAGNP